MKKKHPTYDERTKTNELSLVSGLVAIGNMAYEKYEDLEKLKDQLVNDHYAIKGKCKRETSDQLRYNTQAQKLLNEYAPKYQEACENYGLLDTKLGTAWKTRAKEHLRPSITIGDLFKLIVNNNTKTNAENQPTQEP